MYTIVTSSPLSNFAQNDRKISIKSWNLQRDVTLNTKHKKQHKYQSLVNHNKTVPRYIEN